jgi:hypothetical protein
MVEAAVLKGLIQLSSVLSMIGAGLVAFTWAYPAENRNKHGRILLLWLSVADFLGSLFYFLQSFDMHEESVYCRVFAALDIFFPVASFIWTDFIAYYLFLVVRQRAETFRYNWGRLLFSFHVIAWSVSLATMLLVILFNHAGRETGQSEDDDGGAETAGWCWIQAHNAQERWIWELIGGKFIEWTSGLIIVPYLYISVAYQLYQIDRPQQDVVVTSSFTDRIFRIGKSRTLQTPLLHPSNFVSDEADATQRESNPEFNGTIYSDNNELQGTLTSSRERNAGGRNEATQNPISQRDEENPSKSSRSIPYEEDLSHSQRSSHLGDEDMNYSYNEGQESQGQQANQGIIATDASSRAQSRAYFSRFYVKLFVLPIVFIFIRMWSSLRVILLAAGAEDASRNEFLQIMQAFLDPSQGFFNAVLFVLFSPEDRSRLWETLTRTTRHACIRCLGKNCLESIIATVPFLSSTRPSSADNLEPTVRQTKFNHRTNDELYDDMEDECSAGHGYRSKSPSQNAIAMARQPSSPNKQPHAPQALPRQSQEEGSLRERRLTQSSEVIDIEDDFECSDGDRLSNYSFDGRFDSGDSSSIPSNSNLNSVGSPMLGNQLLPPHIQALQQFHQLQTLQAYSANRSASRSMSQNMVASSPPPNSTIINPIVSALSPPTSNSN